ncbi:import inner membrane translocase subunit, mitochondrial precursor, putative [Candida dubliniensis CD36]|uniref:Mitochondrial import inner membrane translocase subunit Tim21 n=1 Tax=Candida dubliniensis (strain CD36 / ATCC MYA-646 / CBS 7987 / NCPF 3949 / NRRL Y-17841) TaxID=573826 RepID=B9W721_CANDC|nr:import inner membrane translocase subunit, mitochondrial precursor, putative [Candida dubliniensis CD36]CAX44479.1 import inner membrane translocase subunit, mitochondrial precursor, putative [Candida dubliniensis CD36]
MIQRATGIGLRMLRSNIGSGFGSGFGSIRSIILPILSIKPTYINSQLNSSKLLLINFHHHHHNYSTKTAPPPPPPPPPTGDKNAKGKKILNRISRAFTFSLSTLLVIGAGGISILVVSLILSELFLPTGDTRTFNKAVKLIEKNQQAQKILEFSSGERLKAYGINSSSSSEKWIRNRSIQSIKFKKKIDNKDHLLMKFQVESNNGKYGIVSLEQIDNSMWNTEFEYISLDVPGYKRIYIIEPPKNQLIPKIGGGSGFLGLNWGPKKD